MCDVVLLLLLHSTIFPQEMLRTTARAFSFRPLAPFSLQLVPFYFFLRSSDQCKMVRLHAWWSSSLLESRRRHSRIAKCITLENKRQSFVLHGQIKAHCWLLGVRAAIILCGRGEKKRAQKFLSRSCKFWGSTLLLCDGEKRNRSFSRALGGYLDTREGFNKC